MAILTVNSKGQVTLGKGILRHLHVQPGGKIKLELLPSGQATLRAARPTGNIEDFIGLLAGKTTKVATLEEIEDATAGGWAGER